MPGGVASVLDVTVMARHVNAVVVPTLIRKVASELGRIWLKNISGNIFSYARRNEAMECKAMTLW
jgi:hypothetical protein